MADHKGFKVLGQKPFHAPRNIHHSFCAACSRTAALARASIVIGRIFGGGTVAVLQAFIVVIIAAVVGFQVTVTPLILLAPIFMALIAGTFIGLGLTLGSMINDFQGFQLVTSFFTMPLFFLSNSIFPASALPTAVQ